MNKKENNVKEPYEAPSVLDIKPVSTVRGVFDENSPGDPEGTAGDD